MNDAQRAKLLSPVAKGRVHHREQAGMRVAYLETWDVRAHLCRIFGIGGWSGEVIDCALVFEDSVTSPQQSGRKSVMWTVAYRVTFRLMVAGATYTEVAVGTATMGNRGGAHDLAVKSAESDALKRAAVNLGSQFGLSLYSDHPERDVIMVDLSRGEVSDDSSGKPA